MTWSLLDRNSYFGLSRRRLQTLYIVAAAGLAALVPLILLAGFWITSELGKSQRDVELVLSARAAALAQRVDAEVDQQLSALRALSALPSLDADGAGFSGEAARAVAAMPYWSFLAVVQPDATVVFSTKPVEQEAPSDASIRRAAETRRPVIETRSAAPDRRGGILLYVPVVRNDAVKLVLLASFDASDVRGIVETFGAIPGFFSVVVDETGAMLAQSHAAPSSLDQEIVRRLKQEEATRPVGQFQASTAAGKPITVAFVRSSVTGWIAVSAIGSAESDRLMARSVWATAGAAALSLLLTGILGVFIVHTIMERRVSEERLSASRALGELDARLLATTQEALGEQRKASSEREVLLREIYHRVKNNLQIVQSLLRLGARDLKHEQREPFESAVRRIGAMARVHTLLYNSPDLASIDFKDYLDELLRELSEGFAAEERAIESVLETEAMRMPLDTAVPLAFIAVEILTNAFKHAFPEGRAGKISVSVERTGEEAILRIRDDGIGMTYDSKTKRRLGLTIVRKLVQQIGGTLEEPPAGTSAFAIRFPIAGAAATPPPPLPMPSAPIPVS